MESRFQPGQGALTLGAALDPRSIIGVLSAEAKLKHDISLFGDASAGWNWDLRSPEYKALAGLRWRF